jgi:hypothetical protein
VTANLKTLCAGAVLAVMTVACSAMVPAATPGAPGVPGRTPAPGGSAAPDAPSGRPPVSVPPIPGGVPTTGPAAPGANIDSCALLTDAELMSGTGHAVVSRAPSTLTRVFPSVCDIELDVGSLTVSVMSVGGRSMYETSFEPFIGQDSFLDRALEGLGDKAGMAGDDDIMVLSGDVLFDLFYLGSTRPDTEVALRYLAEVILGKLPCLAVGCPGLTPPPAPPSPPPALDVCALLTGQEIEAAVGIPALKAEPTTSGDPGCTWALDTEPFPGFEYVELSVKETGGRQQFDFIANGLYETAPEHVTGLGDDAVKTGTIPGGYIYTVVDDRLVSLKFTLPLAVDDPYALVQPLVATALSRLE